jgi:hypothetical protein
MPMQRIARLAVAAVVLATGPLVAACDSFDTFELFDTKKKLAGERKPVFPEGVPGTSSGVPAELVKGYREPEHADVTDPARVAAEAAAADSTKPRPKLPAQPKPPATPAAAPPPAAAAKPPATASAKPPATAAAKPPPQRTAAKPPTPPAQSTAATTAAAPPAAPPPAARAPAAPPGATPLPWPATQPQAAWPGSPASGTVTR